MCPRPVGPGTRVLLSLQPNLRPAGAPAPGSRSVGVPHTHRPCPSQGALSVPALCSRLPSPYPHPIKSRSSASPGERPGLAQAAVTKHCKLEPQTERTDMYSSVSSPEVRGQGQVLARAPLLACRLWPPSRCVLAWPSALCADSSPSSWGRDAPSGPHLNPGTSRLLTPSRWGVRASTQEPGRDAGRQPERPLCAPFLQEP